MYCYLLLKVNICYFRSYYSKCLLFYSFINFQEICNILSIYWNSFSAVQIQSLLTVITKKNARDASSAEARRMVYIALQSLVKSSLSQDYIKQILPILSDNIHDVNQKVKIAFIQLLICVKENFDSSFKYTDVVSMANLHYRLAVSITNKTVN